MFNNYVNLDVKKQSFLRFLFAFCPVPSAITATTREKVTISTKKDQILDAIQINTYCDHN